MKILKTACFALALGTAATGALAQAYPSRVITWLVPFTAGGPTDAMARNIAAQVSRNVGQQIIIENLGGAGGTLGAGKAAKAKPDGYTFLVGHLGYMGAAPSIYKKLSYDPIKDFDPVFRFPDTPMVLLVPQASPYKTAADLIAFAKKNPGKINFGNAGAGSTSHLIAALFESKAGIDVVSVPYKGAAPAMNDLIGGQVDAMFDQTNTALPQVPGRSHHGDRADLDAADGAVPERAAAGRQDAARLRGRDLVRPLCAEGHAEGSDPEMHQAYLKAMADTAWTQKMAEQGIRLLPEAQYGPEAFGKHTEAEIAKWRKVAVEAKITVD